MNRGSLLAELGSPGAEELVTTLATGSASRIERIVSHAHQSPQGFWYEQEQTEWVLIVRGRAAVEIEGEGEVTLEPGDWLEIPAHCRHRVSWTAASEPTIWLAVFF